MNIRDLKKGDFVDVVKPYSDRRVSFKIIRNFLDDMLILHNENNGRTIHLFYDDETDMKYAKYNFGLEVGGDKRCLLLNTLLNLKVKVFNCEKHVVMSCG